MERILTADLRAREHKTPFLDFSRGKLKVEDQAVCGRRSSLRRRCLLDSSEVVSVEDHLEVSKLELTTERRLIVQVSIQGQDLSLIWEADPEFEYIKWEERDHEDDLKMQVKLNKKVAASRLSWAYSRLFSSSYCL